jgi:hypothetical protein
VSYYLTARFFLLAFGLVLSDVRAHHSLLVRRLRHRKGLHKMLAVCKEIALSHIPDKIKFLFTFFL